MERLKNFILTFFAVFIYLSSFFSFTSVSASPKQYDIPTSNISLRASFYTSYSNSSPERKYNIERAINSIDNTFLDTGCEFSFNNIVGERTLDTGYKIAKVIVNGKFSEGVGGGVCQVSTTLYNAVLLSGLKITEYHPHSLKVSYIAPSFDAMVSSNHADLRFLNNTNNPIVIKATADGEKIVVKILGEQMEETYKRISIVLNEYPPISDEIIVDDNNEYNLDKNQSLILSYPKNGTTSEGFLEKIINGVVVERKKIRSDNYKPIKRVLIIPKTSS